LTVTVKVLKQGASEAFTTRPSSPARLTAARATGVLIWPSHYTRGMVLRFSELLYQNGIFDPHPVNFVIASFNPLFSVRLIPRLSLSKSTDDPLRGPFEKLSFAHAILRTVVDNNDSFLMLGNVRATTFKVAPSE
jgi:hypothetical protein